MPTHLQSIDVGALSWVRPLVGVYAGDYARVASLFAGDPAETSAWSDTIARVQRGYRHREVTSELLIQQLERRGAPGPARVAAGLLKDPRAVVVVTGQQVGILGGPLYTLLKAVTAVARARSLTVKYGIPVIPVFWAEAEDHDWPEVSSANLLDRDGQVRRVVVTQPEGAGRRSCGGLRLPDDVSALPELLRDILPPTEFTAQLIETMARLYSPGERCGTAFASWLDTLVGPLGMPVFEADDPAAKPPVADIFVHELMAPRRTARFVRSSGAFMRVLGHEPQLELDESTANVFRVGPQGRAAVKWTDRTYAVGSESCTLDALVDEARQHPERFSPNVVTRPLVQDTLFPTVCYVAGPAELAYHAQLGQVYREFGIERPLLCSRASATLLDPSTRRFLDKTGTSFEQLGSQGDAVLNGLVARSLPPSIDEAAEALRASTLERTAQLRSDVSAVDPTLVSVVDTTRDRILSTLESMQSRIVQAGKRKDETLRRQFHRTTSLAFPEGHPQERFLSVAFFVNRYGFSLADHLLTALPDDVSKHHLIVL